MHKKIHRMAKFKHRRARARNRMMTIWNVLLICYFIEIANNVALSIIAQNIEDNMESMHVVEAVKGTIGRLPCNITPSVKGDKIILVIWYKDGYSVPIYSFDARNTDFEKGSHWLDEKNLGSRAYFQASSNPASLIINEAQDSDSGIYRCRVDFHKSPTRNSPVQLKIILPPEKLSISDESGTHIPHYTIGPYNEGSSVNVTCVSTGGRPLPNVTWWHETTLLDDTSVILSGNRVKNVLNLQKIERRQLHIVYTCQASNNNVTMPIVSSITLDVNLRPLWVKLQGENRPLSADNEYQLWCEVVGSRPSPLITWWKGSTPMRNTREIISTDGNVTQSVLSFTPTIDDRGKYLSCRAEHTSIPESGTEDGWKLDIYHTPVVTLEFGTNLNTSFIREGADVYFECNIKSNPWVYKVSWRHNGKTLDNNVPEGIIVANQSLVLQNVSRSKSGLYTCIGSNREGDGESNPVHLDIKFAPVCRPGQKTIYSGGRQETIKVLCELEANPHNVTFNWKFNASATEFLDLPASQIFPERHNAVAHYTPMTEHDYGTLLCWGINEIGTQIEPCIFIIIPAGRPDSLTNCTVLNQTYSGFQIECTEGFDGGLPQEFILEAYANGQKQNPIILKSQTPYFELRNLISGIEYNVFLIAQNAKGRSNSTIRQVYTLNNPEKQTDTSSLLASTPSLAKLKSLLPFLLFGCAGAIALTAIIVVFIIRKRANQSSNNTNDAMGDQSTTCGNSDRCETASYALNTQRTLQSSQEVARDLCADSSETLEKNPDIIPNLGTTLNEKEEDEKGFEWINNSNHPRIYATTAVAEQNALSTFNFTIPKDVIPHPWPNVYAQQRIPHPFPHLSLPQPTDGMIDTMAMSPNAVASLQQKQHQTFIPPPTQNKYAHMHNDLTYAELMVTSPVQRVHFTSTLGRPRTSNMKQQEPTIYAQIDLARPNAMYAANSMYITNSATGVTISHPSNAFPPPPAVFANRPTMPTINLINASNDTTSDGNSTITTTASSSSNINNSSSNANKRDISTDTTNSKHPVSLLQTVPEIPQPPTRMENSSNALCDRTLANNTTRF
ncbi:nephrin-like isoform X1 [Contarinia nasturtii]|uniref:nephrin-like isoform X1 n=1 Tax=Contarinia nasturtii TaxID=265458 RepID=UPI0012D40425|nr:nephrin-like isoform X1 [Contarinia nasturtii]XP_031626210.1 nephrin-like isoform X1 [Contarinia nasturtii]XP_031626217.1 nephrin-like isoform X1 [Contarinia nasturtii]XP_031626225.1 nephrin-like isoform X1 [Contarinia nasturtii]XP_031626233.1 nephrin-like isoform X1 [Contarinia nasturtii]XP_031626242.1 nephrin-like isoform X1 [Contarinia nasturtii]